MFSKTFLSSAMFVQLLCMLARPAQAVNMSLYDPQEKVDDSFGVFVEEFYKQAEDTSDAATAAFVSMFAVDVPISLGGNVQFTGKEGVAVFKVAVTGGDQFDHYPRTAEISACTETNTTFTVNGSAKQVSPDGVCVSNDFTTRWTILNGADGQPILVPAVDSILRLDLVQQTPSAGDCNSY